MNIFEMLIFNMVLFAFPLLVYMIYIIANKNVSKEEKDKLFSLTLISSFFLTVHFSKYFNNQLFFFFWGGIIFLGLYQKKYGLSIFLEIMMIISFYKTGYGFLYYTLFYGVLNIAFYFYEKYFANQSFMFFMMLGLYSIGFFFYLALIDGFVVGQFLLVMIAFPFFMELIRRLLELLEYVMQNHLEFQELQKEKQIRLSLFKITHEIKNPVAVCKAYLDMFDVENKEHARKYVPILKNEIERLLLLLQDFLLVNKANMKYEVMDMNMLLEDVSKNIQPLMDENHIRFKVDTLDDELFINGDYNRLNQVMVNVLKNSVEAEASNITLRTHLTSKLLEVYVEDDGKGISKEVMKRIDEPFYTTKSRGTGLGVSLSNEIIHAHSGKMEYHSKEGHGTCVKITLPLYLL